MVRSDNDINVTARRLGLLVVMIAAVSWLPWLGLTLFNTKGEPREAIVAVSILNSGDWILPLSLGADMPYKPPMLAWLIALFSLPAGHVTEFTSRLPSALAAILLVWSTFRFVVRHDGRRDVAALTALVLLTSVEVWRAGWACRVDMVLTAATVGALYSLYGYISRGMRGLPLAAIGLMTVAVLTKGPVGMVVPLLCVWLYNLTRPRDERRQWALTWRLAVAGLLSLVVPAVWYWLAARQGGEEFVRLALEENVGRMTGTMSYASHENGPFYNLATLAAGLLPYTVACLLSLLAVDWRRVSARLRVRNVGSWLRRRPERQTVAYAIVTAVVILLFYTIPKSKRSVYLLPMYPAMAYLITLLLKWMTVRAASLLRGFAMFMSAVAALVGVACLAGPLLPSGWFAKMPLLQPWLCRPAAVILSLLAVGMGLSALLKQSRLPAPALPFVSVAMAVICYWTISAGAMPGLLNAKSDKPVAEAAAAVALDGETIYQYVDDEMLRFYTADFYLGDRLRLFDPATAPAQGVMLIGEKDVDKWTRLYADRYAMGEPLWRSAQRSCDTKSRVLIVPIVRR